MRKTFVNTLIHLAEINDKIVLFTGDLGYSVLEPFIEKFPNRFFNFGIAEQNMMGAAAGMASVGYHVFVYSIANFPIFRCAEQYRNDVDYHDLNVTIVTVGGGLSYGSLGYSHHAIQDYAFMRTMPNTQILAPGDPNEVEYVLKFIIEHPGPSYLRLAKSGEPNIHNLDEILKDIFVLIKKADSRKLIISTGNCKLLGEEILQSDPKYADYSFYSMPIWGMRYKHEFNDFIKKYDEVITLEDHLRDGGFGSWINEIICDNVESHKVMVRCMALQSDVLGKVGSERFLRKIGGLSKEI